MSIEGQNSTPQQKPERRPGAQQASIISLVAGVVSLVFFPAFVGGLGLITGLFAVAMYFGERKAGLVKTVAPLVMGAIGLVLSGFSLAVYFLA